MAGSLGLFAGAAAPGHKIGATTFSFLPRMRFDQSSPRWRPGGLAIGFPTALVGWLDNREDLRGLLDCPGDAADSEIYAAAISRWGRDADRHCIGVYGAVTLMPDGSLRLARSPWGGPSLFWAGDERGVAVASVPRCLFAAGHPRRLKPGLLADLLFLLENCDEEHYYRGVHRVPHGCVVHLTRDGATSHCWYDPAAIPAPDDLPDDEVVARAHELLDRSAALALQGARKPAMLLSGGLDSPLAADALIRQMEPGRSLRSYTAVPLSEWDGQALPAMYGDERPAVEAFAAMHSALEPHFLDQADLDFDATLEPMMLAIGTARASQAISHTYHGTMRAAARDGCDWVFTAGYGNMTYSIDGDWAEVDFLRQGKWGELVRLLKDRPDDPRPMWRILLVHSVLPQLPRGWQRTLYRLARGRSTPIADHASLLRAEAIEALGLRERAASNDAEVTGERDGSREAWLRRVWRDADLGTEVLHGFEQVYGIRQRDIAQYRPLIEFCIGLPTRQFVRGGQDRYLARRMARGRLPEAQRHNRRYGMHNADWHARMTRALPRLRRDLDRLAGHDELARLVDIDRARSLIDNWPDEDPRDIAVMEELFIGLTGAQTAIRFADFVEGRN